MAERMRHGVAEQTRSGIMKILWAGAGIGALLAGAVLLWVYDGGAVFLEMIAAGFASCF
jgi:integral membrane sensor domain MASE1